ncbi:ABC transporter substrate-binding protein [Bifidobacterium sp. LC6]|uniref:ABC transporter substrate-binding protein n=1 Tax=Bifidobacterium colobi TaxID=2809026 RepID=A0ABS5USU3_9BIFI|nr:ABC transporter substrate-binding protein [Bifidobacterium colobi]MBT1174027.1 ABC transporter substrate-binding protein [Bifidobacterium colobi]
MQHRKANRHSNAHGLRNWGIFLGVACALAAAVCAGLFFMGNRGSIDDLMLPEPGGTVKVGVTDLPQSLDVRSQSSPAAERILLDNVYETLIRVDQKNQLQPSLATSWKISSDGLTYTLSIVDKVRFSNNHPLDASDVVWSLQQAVSQDHADVDQLGELKSITNPNASTVVITLAKPNPTLLRALSGRLGIVYDSEAGDVDYSKQAVGSGPFTAYLDTGRRLTLTDNREYHGDHPQVNNIMFVKEADEATLIKQLKAGDLDMAMPASTSVAQEFAAASGFKVSEGTTTSKVLLAFNNGTDSLMSDEQIRKAMRHLIDASAIASSQPDSAGPLGGPISPLESGYEDRTGDFPHNVGTARTMLGFFSPEFIQTVNLVVTERYRTLGENIAQQISQVPLPKVNLEVVSDEDYAKRIQDGAWELTLMSMDDTDDAGTFANPDSMFHYDHAEAEQAYASAREATNDQEYAERMKAYAKILSEDAASDWLYTRKCFTVASDTVSGYPTSLIETRMPLVSLKKNQQ